MFEYSSVIHPRYKVDFARSEAFARAMGRPDDSYWVGPADGKPDNYMRYDLSITYSNERYFDDGPLALLRFCVSGHPVELTSRLSIALQMFCYLVEQPAHLMVPNGFRLDLTAVEAAQALGLSGEQLITPKVAAYASGEHLAPTETGWRLYLVETYGEVVPLVDSSTPAPVALAMFVLRQSEKENLSERLATFNPPNAAALLRA